MSWKPKPSASFAENAKNGKGDETPTKAPSPSKKHKSGPHKKDLTADDPEEQKDADMEEAPQKKKGKNRRGGRRRVSGWPGC